MDELMTRKRQAKTTEPVNGKSKQPKTAGAAYALAHPHMIEVVDPEWRARLRSYQN